MAGDDANTLTREFDYLWSKQGNFRMLWNTAAQFAMPAWDNFIGEWAEGVNRNTRIFDSTGVTANERFAAAMQAMLTPASQIWHKLQASDERARNSPRVKRYCDELNKIVFGARYNPAANFASQTDECYMSLGAFGNNSLFTDELVGTSLRYRSVPLSETCWSLNHQGSVDSHYRKFTNTAKQAVQQFGENRLPQQVRNLFARNPFEETEFLHIVKPNMEHTPGAFGARGMAFSSWYLHYPTKHVIEAGGFRVFPYGVGRYRVAPRESYGRGPCTTCLPDVRTANEMVKTNLRAGQKAVDPPILVAEESLIQNFNQRSAAINYGMLTSDGKPLAAPFESKGNWELNKELLADTRQTIRDTFLNTLFQILVENPNMTATEALLRAQEKGELIAPAMGRQQSEFLGPIVARELDILHHAGQLPPPPPELLRSGKGLQLVYTSPLARAMRAEEGTAIMNTVADIGTLSQGDPSVRYLFDYHDAAREMAEIRGCPAKLLRSEEQVNSLMEHAAQQQQQAQAAQAAPDVASSIQKLASAANLAGGSATGGSPGAVSVPQAA